MADFPRLPLPELAPSPGQVDTALRLVHRRRRRSLATAAASVAGGIVVLLLLTDGGPRRTAELAPTNPLPTAPGTASAAPRATRTPDPVPTSGPPRGALPDGGTVVRPSASIPEVTRLVPPKPTEAAPRTPAVRHRWPIAQSLQEDSPTNNMPESYGEASYPNTGEVFFTLNHAVGDEGGTVEFPQHQEVEVTVVRPGETEPLWRWGVGQKSDRTGRHTLTIPAGRRSVWEGRWDGYLDDNRRLDRGSYELVLTLLTEPEVRIALEFRVNEYGVMEPEPILEPTVVPAPGRRG